MSSSVASLRNAFKGLQTSVRENKKRVSNMAEISSSSSSNSTSSNNPRMSQAAITILEHNLNEIQEKINTIIATDISTVTSEARLANLVEREAKLLDNYSNQAYDKLTKYSNVPGMKQSLCDQIQQTLTTAAKWTKSLNNKYVDLKMFEIQSTAKINIEVSKFDEKGQQSIYEFLNDFNACYRGRGSDQVKANQLWKKYLSPAIQADTETMKDDFKAIQDHLLENYGDIDSVVNSMLRSVEISTKPTIKDRKGKNIYIRKLFNALQKIESIPEKTTIPQEVWETSVLSKNSLLRLMRLLTDEDQEIFAGKLSAAGFPKTRIFGKYPFQALVKFVEEMSITTAQLVDLETNTTTPSSVQPQQRKAAHVVQEEQIAEPKQPTSSSSINLSVQQPWFDNRFSKPCGINSHQHEIGHCPDFWTLTPYRRRSNTDRRICWTCLGPREKCKVSDPNNLTFFCSNAAKVPKQLLCQMCEDFIKKNNKPFSPTNVLMCHAKSHVVALPSLKSITPVLLDFIPGIDVSKLYYPEQNTTRQKTTHTQHNTTPNTTVQSHNIAPTNTPVSSMSLSKAVVIDSTTGELSSAVGKKISYESNDDPIFIMQVLKIGTESVLTMFDTGAGTHLIEGGLAESQGLEKISSSPTSLSVVGGGSVPTHFGIFRFFLGPTADASHKELICHGIQFVTEPIHYIDLTQANEQVKLRDPSFNNVVLPAHTGGSRTRLLIGIKDPEAHPVPIFTLPSGLGLFKSKFKDMYGSQYCYGGPHSSFNVNKTSTNTFILFAQSLSQYRASVYDSTFFYEDFPPQPPKVFVEANDYMTTKNYVFSCHTCSRPIQEIPDNCPTLIAATMARYKDLIEEDTDDQPLLTYRCLRCAQCSDCKTSGKARAISIRERFEQDVINNSVRIDFHLKEVRVTMPFIKCPQKELSRRFGGPDNYRLALKIYQQQCKKNAHVKAEMVKAQKDLMSKGFMMPLKDLPHHNQQAIAEAPNRHYFPWHTVYKEDSVSTPVRMVVDPRTSGLNDLLAKGENVVSKVIEILVRNRMGYFSTASDIVKLYNMLKLEESEYPMSLFLFHESLDPATTPDVHVMLTAWYGVVSSGNQADAAILKLADNPDLDFPQGKEVVRKFRYVDDLNPSANTQAEQEEQIKQTQELLAAAGFRLKYIVRSGQPPPPEASTDGTTVKVLGYTWTPEQDFLSPSFAEINFNTKKRGSKKPNPFPINTEQDVRDIITATKLTKRHILSKVAELYDPLGCIEPLKVHLKIQMIDLKKYDWDDQLTQEEKDKWSSILEKFVHINKIQIPRPATFHLADASAVRLIAIADAGAHCCGAAIYVGAPVPGGFSCRLVAAKSRLITSTIPRNELNAILLLAELTYIVKNAMPIAPKEIVYVSDSTIAVSWCTNLDIKLRQFVANRVETIRRVIEWTTGTPENVPIFHVSGTQNVADLITKIHPFEAQIVDKDSVWQNGYPWMRLPSAEMPLLPPEEMHLSSEDKEEMKKECQASFKLVPEPEARAQYLQVQQEIRAAYSVLSPPVTYIEDEHPTICTIAAAKPEHTIDFIGLGWNKALRIISYRVKAISILKHRSHTANNNARDDCIECKKEGTQICDSLEYTAAAEKAVFRLESAIIKKTVHPSKLKDFRDIDGVLYYVGRLDQANQISFRDVDFSIFLDNCEFQGLLPVVRVESQLFFSFLMNVHLNIRPHAGIETTVREIFKKMYVLGSYRHIVKRVRTDCTTCAELTRKTVDLELAKHHYSRTLVAPVFYTVQMDVVHGFKQRLYRGARKTAKIYALVIVCLHTSATNILALESAETQEVVNALERHGCRYGMPAEVYVDAGSNLAALDKYECSLRDVDSILHDSRGIRVYVSTPKSHEERGRVENRVKLFKEMLEKHQLELYFSFTPLQWETVFAKMSNILDDMPIAKGNCSNVAELGFDVITPNKLKLGRNNYRSVHIDGRLADPALPSQLLDQNREIMSLFFQTLIDRLHFLQFKPKKWSNTDSRLPKVDDTVLFKFNESNSHLDWKLGIIVEVEDRKAKIMYNAKANIDAVPTKMYVHRCFRDIVILFSEKEIFVNSKQYFQNNLIKT